MPQSTTAALWTSRITSDGPIVSSGLTSPDGLTASDGLAPPSGAASPAGPISPGGPVRSDSLAPPNGAASPDGPVGPDGAAPLRTSLAGLTATISAKRRISRIGRAHLLRFAVIVVLVGLGLLANYRLISDSGTPGPGVTPTQTQSGR